MHCCRLAFLIKMIENMKVKFEQRKHFENINASNLESKHDFSKTLVVGEKGRNHATPNAQQTQLKTLLANNSATNFDSKPARRSIPLAASPEYIPKGKLHVVPPSEQHKTVDVVFDNGGREPKIGNFPTNMSRFMKGRDFDLLVEEINAPTTKTMSGKTKTLSSSQQSLESNPETKDSTMLTRTQSNSNNNINRPPKKLDSWKIEELKQIKLLTVSKISHNLIINNIHVNLLVIFVFTLI